MAFVDRSPNAEKNYRYQGTGRMYCADPGTGELVRLGGCENIALEISSEQETVEDVENAARATVLTATSSTEAQLGFEMREMSGHNLALALQGSTPEHTVQAAGGLVGVAWTGVVDVFKDLGKLDCYVKRATVADGPFQVGETVTDAGDFSGLVAWIEGSVLELVNVSGTLAAGATLTGGTSSASAPVVTAADVAGFVVTDKAPDASPAVRYVAGADYDSDADYGLIRRLSGGAIAGEVFVSCNCPAMEGLKIQALQAGTLTKTLVFVSDKSDKGVRERVTFHKAEIVLDGSFNLTGDDLAKLPVKCTVLKDTGRPAGEEFFSIEKW